MILYNSPFYTGDESTQASDEEVAEYVGALSAWDMADFMNELGKYHYNMGGSFQYMVDVSGWLTEDACRWLAEMRAAVEEVEEAAAPKVGDDGYLFFARELQKACAGVTIVDQVSTRIKVDNSN